MLASLVIAAANVPGGFDMYVGSATTSQVRTVFGLPGFAMFRCCGAGKYAGPSKYSARL
ncbi:MAG: hypothetical protein M3N48_07150 [Verrucomicrobiota bacterium]|nr:hypothetical protein [Verrucomicrobiota bacterium]